MSVVFIVTISLFFISCLGSSATYVADQCVTGNENHNRNNILKQNKKEMAMRDLTTLKVVIYSHFGRISGQSKLAP
jgi:hypothetical protein